ncbi:DUF3768 domain-containing protein [Xinfangfangia sp. D13-10-4-6]|uniref:DUF3768 domain-containing protein n=1 Tax=Pseudogemmobacter hezensis TaxID=2737662 RepID=UPI0015543A99|nr:DUF3768 domain-containing protein [Pseudogemmobacter hezensis]NPD15057.1 DUF3768 domain-containing protein [Pseudogemmobacter hezensis]
MARHQCITCETVNTASAETCPCCGGPVFDLDRYEATRSEAKIIGAQNDAFRKALAPAEWQGQQIRGRVVVTRGIRDMGPEFVQAALEITRNDENFMDDHSRYGARSFGMPDIAHDGDTFRIYWKIDLYDNEELMGPEVESDPSQTIRVLTLCLPEEY